MKKHCFTCGGHGLKDKVCPECGLKHNSMNLDKKPVEAKKLVIAAKVLDTRWVYRCRME